MDCFAPVAFSRMTSCLDSLQLLAAGRHPGWLVRTEKAGSKLAINV
jgi:hypothetical protein